MPAATELRGPRRWLRALLGCALAVALIHSVGAGRTVRLVNLGGPDGGRLLDRVAADIGTAVAAVEAFWGVDWPRRITVVATGSDKQFSAEAGGGTWAGVAAVTVRQRIVFAPGAAAMSETALRIVLAHELFHYAARADTAPDAPRWLTEGVADFVARPHVPAVGGAGVLPMALPSDADLDTPGPTRSLAYDRAWGFARFVADTYGAGRLRELYLAACSTG